MYRVFFNWASPEFANYWPVSSPLTDQKKSKFLVILTLRKLRGGPVEGFMGGVGGGSRILPGACQPKFKVAQSLRNRATVTRF